MNNIKLTLTESTIENFLKKQLDTILFDSEEKVLHDESGVKIIANVHVKKIQFNDFDLSQPDMLAVKNITVDFEKLNIVISVDIPTFENRSVIEVPDIPEVRDPIFGTILIPRRVTPDIIIWSLKLFEDNPDIRLTIGLEGILRPSFSVNFKIKIDDFKVKLSFNELEIHDFVIPDSIANEVKNNIINEIKSKININNHIEEIVGMVVRSIPVHDFPGLIMNKVIKNKQFEDFVGDYISSKIGEHTLLVPSNFNFKLGPTEAAVELTINTPVLNITDNDLHISIDVNEL